MEKIKVNTTIKRLNLVQKNQNDVVGLCPGLSWPLTTYPAGQIFRTGSPANFAEVSLSINANQGPRSRDSNQAIRFHGFLLARPLFFRR